jgi:cleavage stimulation factor subunit 3
MADDAELAFLQAQQEEEYDPSAGYSNAEALDDQEEYDPAATYSPHESTQSASMPPESATDTPQATDGADQNGVIPAPASADVSAAPTPSKRPRTVGGFVDESEDEEEESAAQPNAAQATLLNAPVAAETPQPSFTNTPNNTLPNPDVQLHSAQDQGPASLSASVAVNEPAPSVASSLPNGSTPVPDATKQGAPDFLTAASARASAAPVTPVPTSTSLPKARLPQDRVGILEDRIAEDPRGDTEAWQGLIDEHRRRHKNDDARAVFERFLKLFPTAVSNTDYAWLVSLIHLGCRMGQIHRLRD